jgi:hypothetical protein
LQEFVEDMKAPLDAWLQDATGLNT